MSTFKAKNAIFTIIFSILLLLGLIIWIIPTAISTPLGNRTAVKLINRQLDGKAEIRQLSLSWFGPQRISGIVIKDGNQEVTASCQQIVIESPLLNLLYNRFQKAEGTIAGLNINKPFSAIYDAKGRFKLHGSNTLDLSLVGLTGLQSPFDLTLNYTPIENKPESGNVNIKLSSTSGDLEGSFTVDKNIYLTNNASPIKFLWKADPSQANFTELLDLSEQSEKLTTLKPFKVKGSISQLNLPLDGNFNSATIVAALKIAELHLHSKEHDEELYFTEISAHLKKEKSSSKLSFSIQGDAGEPENLHGDFLASGFIDKDLSLEMDLRGKKLPITFLAALSPTGKNVAKQLGALFGKKVDIETKILLNSWSGPIQSTISGDNGYFFLEGIAKNGILSLQKPIRLETKATKELGQDILQPLFPLFTSMMMADNTLKATIDPQGFSLPLKNFHLEEIQIGTMQVDLGVVHFQNQGELAKLLKPFKPRNNQILTVWFTPIYLEMQKGIVTLKRVDMLISNSYPVAAWGIVDILDETLNLNIGISTESFGAAVKRSSPYIVLPLQGKIGKASIDTSQLKFSLVTTIAQQFATAGSTFDKMLSDASQTSPPIPPSTTTPLPWENKSTVEKDVKEKTEPKKLQFIEQEARSFLKKLLQ